MRGKRKKPIIVFDQIRDIELKLIPHLFYGDIFVKDYVRCTDLKIRGNLYVGGLCSISGNLVAESVYVNELICCYGSLITQDLICNGKIIIGENAIISGDVECNELDSSTLEVLGNVRCAKSIRVDRTANIRGSIIVNHNR